MTGARPDALLAGLRAVVGRRHVLTGDTATRAFTRGYRFGGGPALAVVRPGTLLEQFRAFEACIAAGAIVIMQAANTGLTGGSTPEGDYDRPVVIISTLRIAGIHLVRDGRQAICLAGATLYALERRLRPLGREPHSVIGSTCIGASVIGGVCNSSGGALVRRGPAYTEYALFARACEQGVELVNHLGLRLAGDVEHVLRRVQQGGFDEADVMDEQRRASGTGYARKVRDVDAPTPGRFNADPGQLFEASGSGGKVMVLAVRLDTFPADDSTSTFYIGTHAPAPLERLRRCLLTQLAELPVSGEYIHRDAFDMAARYGKDVFLAVRGLGPDRLPALFRAKAWIDGVAARLPRAPANVADRILQAFSRLTRQHLPARLLAWRDRFEHHLILKVGGDRIAETRRLLDTVLAGDTVGAWFECTADEAEAAFLHRFAVAGAALRYKAIHRREVGDIIALDVALRRNDLDWLERLPPDLASGIAKALYYGHFLCHVLHQDYVLRPGTDARALEHAMWALLDARGAEYPAEHNVGRLYPAKPALQNHYRALDPTNSLNPGIGHTSRNRCWC